MQSDRLNELKDRVLAFSLDCQDRRDIARLIDAEQSRQSVPDAEVQDAIEWFSRRSSSSVHMSGETMYVFRWCPAGVAETIDSALSAYRKPSADQAGVSVDEIQKVTQWIIDMREYFRKEAASEQVTQVTLDDDKMCELIVTALRRMAGEGE